MKHSLCQNYLIRSTITYSGLHYCIELGTVEPVEKVLRFCDIRGEAESYKVKKIGKHFVLNDGNLARVWRLLFLMRALWLKVGSVADKTWHFPALMNLICQSALPTKKIQFKIPSKHNASIFQTHQRCSPWPLLFACISVIAWAT